MEVKLITYYTESYKRIFNELFIKRIPPSFEPIVVDYVPDINSVPGFVMSDTFKTLSFRRVELIYNHIKSNMGNVVIFCDVDIVFFKDFKEDVLERIKDYDILFQDNTNGTYNCGFMVFMCSEKTLKFWEMIMNSYNENKNEYINEQFAVNELIHTTDIKHGFLPETYHANPHWCNPNNSGDVYRTINSIPQNAFLSHCIAIENGEENKHKIMSEIIEKFKNNIE